MEEQASLSQVSLKVESELSQVISKFNNRWLRVYPAPLAFQIFKQLYMYNVFWVFAPHYSSSHSLLAHASSQQVPLLFSHLIVYGTHGVYCGLLT